MNLISTNLCMPTVGMPTSIILINKLVINNPDNIVRQAKLANY